MLGTKAQMGVIQGTKITTKSMANKIFLIKAKTTKGGKTINKVTKMLTGHPVKELMMNRCIPWFNCNLMNSNLNKMR